MPNIVIVGAGFAGLKCAMELAAHREMSVTLIDKNNYQQFHPLLYQIAASMLSPGNAAFALRDVFRGNDNVDVVMNQMGGVDLARRTVTTQWEDLCRGLPGPGNRSEVNFYASFNMRFT